MKPKRNCLICNKEFELKSNGISHSYRKYCSRKCVGISQQKYKDRTFEASCNKCGKLVYYSSSANYRRRIREKTTMCNGCSRSGQKRTKQQRIRISEGTKRAIHTPHIRKKILIGNARSDVRQRRREARLQQIHLSGQATEFNRAACEFFDFLNILNGWNGKHALNGGECQIIGYSLDYYEPTINLVIEWDEKHHYNVDGVLRPRDVKRQQRIKEHLNCVFLRIKESEIL